MGTYRDSYSGAGAPSDPWTELRWERADAERRAWLDEQCRRDLEIRRAEAAKPPTSPRTPRRIHIMRPAGDRTWCGSRVVKTRPGATLCGHCQRLANRHAGS